MASRKAYTNSFAGGEMSPLMLGHIEDEGYRTGFARGRNMLVLPTGAATKRPPFEFVRAAKAGVSTIKLFPFVYGDGDSYVMEWGPAHIRLYSEGGVVMYATPIPVASVDLATETFTTVNAHGLTVDTQVRITHKGTSIPGNLATGTIYFVQAVPSATTFRVALTAGAGAPLDLTTNDTIDETSFWRQSELPREYVVSRQVTRNGNNLDAASAHGLVSTHGDAVHFTTSASDLPAPLVVGTVYYTRYIDADTFSVYPTRADALANTNQIVLTDAGTGTHTFHLAYYRGDLTWGGSLTLAAGESSRAFYCQYELPTTLPTVEGWSQMPADGTFEISHAIGAEAIAALNYDQSFDEFSYAANVTRASRLVRSLRTFPSGTSTTADKIVFAIQPVDFAPSIASLTFATLTRNFGEYYSVTWGISAQFCVVSGTTVHSVLAGDVVYMEGTLGAGDAMTGGGAVAGAPGFFLVTEVGKLGDPTEEMIRMRRIDGGAEAFNSSGASPATGFIRVVGSSSKLTNTYVVTALLANSREEGVAGASLTVTNNLEVPGSSNVLTWVAVSGASRYRVYRKIDEAYGLIGETSALTFTDDGITPDLAYQPPIYDSTLVTAHPSALANFQQRGCFAGTIDNPRGIWLGKTGTRSTMSYHERLLLDDDRIQVNVAARERTLVKHLVPMTHLIAMTSAAEIRITGTNSDTLTPTSIDARPMSHVGCTGVRPIVVNGYLLWVGARNQHVYEMQPQPGIVREPVDTSVRAAHLFDDYTIVQSAEQRSPVQIEWWTRSDGKLLGLTYMPEQSIKGWHVHEAAGTSAFIMSVAVVPESDGERLYAAIRRTINGSPVIHIERMGRIAQPATLTACKYLDSVITYSGTATTTFSVPHLPGQVVYAVADGRVQGPFTVSNGAITLTTAASTVHIGLLYTPELRALPPAMLIDGFGKGRELNVNHVSLRVDNSCSCKVAAYEDSDAERNIPRIPWPVPGLDDTRLRSKDVEASVDGGWGRNAQVVITQDVPLPLTVVSMTVDVELGGP